MHCVHSVESTEVLGQRVPYYNLFNGLLALLAILHAYWCVRLCKSWSL